MLVSLREISKSYGSDLILNKISFDINKNDRIGLVGINGCGKSTLLNIITQDIYYDLGKITKKNNLTIGYLKQNVFFNKMLRNIWKCKDTSF